MCTTLPETYSHTNIPSDKTKPKQEKIDTIFIFQSHKIELI